MDKNQKINCTVASCQYNKNKENLCSLGQIIVTPVEDCHTENPDESMCSSYKYREE